MLFVSFLSSISPSLYADYAISTCSFSNGCSVTPSLTVLWSFYVSLITPIISPPFQYWFPQLAHVSISVASLISHAPFQSLDNAVPILFTSISMTAVELCGYASVGTRACKDGVAPCLIFLSKTVRGKWNGEEVSNR